MCEDSGGGVYSQPSQLQETVVQTINNQDGTVSIISVDPNNPVIALPDGTTATVQGLATVCAQLSFEPLENKNPPKKNIYIRQFYMC